VLVQLDVVLHFTSFIQSSLEGSLVIQLIG
ncbi:unnamed protein product, partial [marine sediment metagenome]